MQKVNWIILLIFLALGFAPYKFPRNANSIKDNEILVCHQESTCVSDFSIIKGKLEIPKKLSPFFSEQVYELSIVKEGSPFQFIVSNQPSWELMIGSDFIISGKVIGVDSIYKNPCNNYAVFQVDKWEPTEYGPNFLTFSKSQIIIYFVTLLIWILASISFLIFGNKRKDRT